MSSTFTVPVAVPPQSQPVVADTKGGIPPNPASPPLEVGGNCLNIFLAGDDCIPPN